MPPTAEWRKSRVKVLLVAVALVLSLNVVRLVIPIAIGVFVAHLIGVPTFLGGVAGLVVAYVAETVYWRMRRQPRDQKSAER
ncbi:MAG: hypothetical protein JWQ11_1169 [Rhizobacter sp.]|nr:hypothetical protein [Rhizobacter sp.]